LDDEAEKRDRDSINMVASKASLASVEKSVLQAKQKYTKPINYDRKLLDDGGAKYNAKKIAFQKDKIVRDPYTGNELELRVKDAKLKYGDDWVNHLAEADHNIALKKVYDDNKENGWATIKDIQEAANSKDNIEVVSRKFNNAKRARTNEEFVDDDRYLEEKNISISKSGKAVAKKNGRDSERAIDLQLKKKMVANIMETGHKAGIDAAEYSGTTAATMSGVMNIVAVIKGEKSVKDALGDTAKDTGKRVASGYAIGSSLTVVSHTLTSSSSKFLQALGKANVPENIITAVITTGDVLLRYGQGEIDTEECIIELGNRGLTLTTTGYSAILGQAMIPIPIVGSAIGALVGSIVTRSYYHNLVQGLRQNKVEEQKMKLIQAQCQELIQQENIYRAELQKYLQKYFKDYQDCFDDALSIIESSMITGDADGVIRGANKITRKLGGNVCYNDMEEFNDYLESDEKDIL